MKAFTAVLVVMFIMTAVMAMPNDAKALSLSELIPTPPPGAGLSFWLLVELFINDDFGDNITWTQLKVMFYGEGGGDGCDDPSNPPPPPPPPPG